MNGGNLTMKFLSEQDKRELFESILYPKLPYRSLPKKTKSFFRNVNSRICSECGGECCKRCGCQYSPDDFKDISFEGLKRELEKGYISIDYVDGEVILQSFGVYILRVRNQDSPIVDTGFRNKGPCILLTEKGCKLSYKKRPSGGKLLIPSDKLAGFLTPKRQCKSQYPIEDCCYEWKPHQKLLSQLADYFQEKDIPCSI